MAKSTKKIPQKAPVPPKIVLETWQLNSRQLLWLSVVLALLHFSYAFLSNGFYQQDEAAHFISMREFWYAPNSVLSNWAKAGYKLIYALPALLGKEFVLLVNSFFSAFSAYLAYKVAQQAGSKVPIFAFVALALQPLWFNLAFRNYSEIPSAFLLILGVYAHQRQKFWLSALALSYVCFIRQEFLPLLALYFVYLIVQKNYVAALLTSVFPLLQNIWGGIVNNDALYLLHQLLQSGSQIAAAYPRQGFEHYFLMSITIFGTVGVSLFLVYLSQQIFQKKISAWVIWLPVLYYLFLQAIFNLQSLPIGPAGGGNLRYMLIVSPLVGVISALALDILSKTMFRKQILIVLGIFCLLVAIFMSYENNYVVFTEERDWRPLLGVVLCILLMLFPMNARQYALSFSGLLLLMGLLTIRPLKISEEDKACQKLAQWYMDFESKNGKRALLLHHAMFYYYLGRTSYDFTPKAAIINEKNLAALPKGGLIIWDTHYSYRPELRKDALPHTYFLEKREQYKIIHSLEATTPDGEYTIFGAVVFEKLY